MVDVRTLPWRTLLAAIVPRRCRIVTISKKLGWLFTVVGLPTCLLADFSYEQSTKMTGGSMMGMMKLAGAFSKQAREPIQASVSVKGNRMVHGYKDHATVIDLDSETITEINFQ